VGEPREGILAVRDFLYLGIAPLRYSFKKAELIRSKTNNAKKGVGEVGANRGADALAASESSLIDRDENNHQGLMTNDRSAKASWDLCLKPRAQSSLTHGLLWTRFRQKRKTAASAAVRGGGDRVPDLVAQVSPERNS